MINTRKFSKSQLGKAVKRYRIERLNVSQRYIAECCGVNRATVSRTETGKIINGTVLGYMLYLGLTIEDIWNAE